MSIERVFHAKTLHTRRDDNGTWSVLIRTQDDYKFEFRCGEYQAKLVEERLASEVKEQ